MKIRLGDILLKQSIITQEQLDNALKEQKKTGLKLGQVLTIRGLINELQVVNMLCEQLNIERFRPEAYPPDQSLSKLISADIVKTHQVVPVKLEGNLLSLAMVDPLDIEAIDFIEDHIEKEVKVIVCAEQELNELVRHIYGANLGINEFIDTIHNPEDMAEENVWAGNPDLEVGKLRGMAQEAPVVRLVNEILSQAAREGASDVHISPEKDTIQVRFRIDGKLHDIPSPPKSLILPILSRLKLLASMDIAILRTPQDGRFTVKMNHREINIRASTIPTIYGENLVLRLLDTSSGVFSLNQIGMSESDIQKTESALNKPYGMILSTGPTGSGKTTTLYSILKDLNKPDVNIITLEDPVEYRVDKIRQTQLNRKAGMTFASGIRSILRQDPDVIMVGEIRDSETAGIAVQSALTGHKVLSTLHTNNAAGAITRFLDMGIAPFLLSSVLLILIAQRLVRQVCPVCKKAFEPTDAALKYWGIDKDNSMNCVQAAGCFNCMNTGYKGRTGIFEVLLIDEMIQDMIIRNKAAHEITLAAQRIGKLNTLKDNAAEKVRSGLTTMEEASSVVMI
ncbi:Putative general secretion pathway II protein, GspE-like [Desulfonema limicola]|uniref:General secretion pathway II protein, GspE-like n=1 Tax=Desulfonema limicola TaxID=45656 RepID=A0A975B5U8_9BACT|nr:GspE/PulE family protein [Desulfonema limicola]QTA79325.1 Putative general secretion pathway II protein, GspE-like [Desulfonema limicola]